MNIYTRLFNAGMTGYGAAQSYLLGQRLLETIETDLIVFVYTSLMPAADHHFLKTAEVDEHGIAVRGHMDGNAVTTDESGSGWLSG